MGLFKKKKKWVTVGYRYGITVHMGVCYGPVDRVEKILASDREAYTSAISTTQTVNINQPSLFGGDEKEGGLSGTMHVQMGADNQTPSPLITAQLGGNIPAFRGILGFVYRGIMSANNPYLKPFSFVVRRIVQGWQGGTWYAQKAVINNRDMNPAHIVYECLTNTDWGMGYPVAAIDDASFRAAADTLNSEGFGLSLMWNQQNSIEAFLGIIFNHIAGALSVDPKTGKYQISLTRRDYNANNLPIFDESNISEVVSYQRAGWGELVNEVTVKYTDSKIFEETAITVQNLAVVQIQGGVVNQTLSFTGITSSDIAQRVAMRELIMRSSPLARVQLKVNRKAWNLLQNDVFKLSWAKYGITQMVMRVASINTGTLENGLITVDAVEDVFGLPSSVYTKQQDNEWQNPLQPPAPSPYRLLTEVNYYDLASTIAPADIAGIDADDGYPMMFASRPSIGAYNYKLLINGAVVDDGAHCAVGTITTALAKEEFSSFVVSVDDPSQIAVGDYAIINSEYVRVDSFNTTTNTLTVARGTVDTVPQAHPANSLIFFADGRDTADSNAHPAGAIVQAKVITRTGLGELDPSLAPVDTVTIQARHSKPYPPAKFRINDQYLPTHVDGAIVVSWNERNRLKQDSNLMTQNEASISPEVGTRYDIKVYDQNGTLRRTINNITGTSYTYPELEEVTDCGGEQAQITIELFSIRDGLASWQSHIHTFTREYGDYETPVDGEGWGNNWNGNWSN